MCNKRIPKGGRKGKTKRRETLDQSSKILLRQGDRSHYGGKAHRRKKRPRWMSQKRRGEHKGTREEKEAG